MRGEINFIQNGYGRHGPQAQGWPSKKRVKVPLNKYNSAVLNAAAPALLPLPMDGTLP